RNRPGGQFSQDAIVAALFERPRHVIIEMAPLAFAEGYMVQFDVDGAGEIEGDPLALKRALMNILQNAINHGGRKGNITLTA
ncbi:sensor histidine kinase, partial [Rhizobium leguminosarum]